MKKVMLFLLIMVLIRVNAFSQIKAYCYVTYDPSMTTPKGPASFHLNNPALITSIANQSAQQFLVAGTWAVDKWLGAVNGTNDLISIDTITGARTLIGNMGIPVTGLSYDDKTSHLYAVAWDGLHSSLYTINVTSGAATLVSQCDTSYLINLACDSAGNLYSVSVSGDKLYSINKTTGVLTLRGAIGFNASYTQDMEFDKTNNILYMTAFNGTTNQGQLRTVNTTTGLTTLIGNFAGGAEISGFAIPYSTPTTDAGVKAFLLPSNTGCNHTATDTVRVTVKNFGTLNVNTPFDVICKLDGVPLDTIPIAVPFHVGDTVNITFPVVDLSAAGIYHFVAFTNLSGDNNLNNDTLNYTVTSADAGITIRIHTDTYGTETTWKLVNNTTQLVVDSGGPYNNITGGYLVTTDYCGLSTDCYTFTIYDAFHDGICCAYGNGFYEILWNGISMGVNSGSFADSAQVLNICPPAANDVGVTSIISPVSSCTPDMQDVIVVVKNLGTDPQSNFAVSYKINGGPQITDTIHSTLASGDSIVYTFATQANLTTPGSYGITSYTSLVGDAGISNDTTIITVSSGGATVPYSMGFEPTEDFNGWSIQDVNGDGQTWVIMTYNGNFGPYRINYYSGFPTNADDWFFSKCIGLETGTTYKLRFYYRETYTGNYERMNVSIGTNNTPTAMTTLLVDLDSIINTNYQLQDVYFTVPANGTYYIGWHAYSDLNAQSLSIDDINISVPLPNDPGVVKINAPVSNCQLGTENVTVSVVNFGTNTLTSIPVAYKINTNAPVTETISASLAPGDTILYTFTTQANLSAAGNYSIKAYTSLGGDPNPANDTTTVIVTNGPGLLPYSMGFEPTEDFTGWKIENTNADANTWTVLSYYGNTGPYCVYYPFNYANPADDWLISKCLQLNSGTTYSVSFFWRVASETYPEKMAVYLGNAQVSTAMTTQLLDMDSMINSSYSLKDTTFTVPVSGVYFVGWHCYSAANMFYLYLDDINISEYIGINDNNQEDNITLYPNPANDNFFIHSSRTINKIRVMNALGAVMFDSRIHETKALINTSKYSNGIYFVQIETDKGSITKKVQVIR